MTVTPYYPTCPTCTGPLFALRPGTLTDDRRLRLTCGECGRVAPLKAWRRWLRSG